MMPPPFPRAVAAVMSRTLPRPVPRRRALVAVVAVVAAAVATSACARDAAPGADAVDLATARAELESGRAIVFDLREPAAHATGVAAGARLLPMSRLKERLAEIPIDPSRPVLLICNTQNRSKATLRALRETGGYAHVRYVDGGMSEWARRGWPMVPPAR